MFEYTIIAIAVAFATISSLKVILLISCYRLENKLNKVKREILAREFKLSMGYYMLDQIKTNRDNLSSAYKRSYLGKCSEDFTIKKFNMCENMCIDIRLKYIVELNKIYRDKLYGQF